MTDSGILGRVISILVAPRPVALLSLVSLVVGVCYALTMMPVPVILGTGDFWRSPGGIISGVDSAALDAAEHFVGYLYLTQGPWTFPILVAPSLGAPAGTNAFWVDAIPGVSLAGKLIFSATGLWLNLFGPYLFACLVMPGVAMTALLAAAGQRSLIAAIAAAVIGVATPWLLFRWGHAPLIGHFWIILGLALYVTTRRRSANWRDRFLWLGLLCGVFTINLYLFVMTGACWAASLLQRRLDHKTSTVNVLCEALMMVGSIICLGLVEGVVSPALGTATTREFGLYSMNLLSPFVPQMSGVIPPLANYRIGMNAQYEGFGYFGLGVLLIVAFSARAWIVWLRDNARFHVVLICVFGCFLLFALSNKVYLGSHLILHIPLPDSITLALGTFRSSGRFFWPVGYAVAAGSIVLVLRRFPPRISLPVLAIGIVVQLIDVEPLREAVTASGSHPADATLSMRQAEQAAARSDAVIVYPSYDCVDAGVADDSIARADRWLLHRANMDMQLVAARANLPINSVYSGRDSPQLREKCLAEAAAREQALNPGTLYVYLTPFTPSAAQFQGQTPQDVCSTLDWAHYCLIPRPVQPSPSHRTASVRRLEAEGAAPPTPPAPHQKRRSGS